MPRRHAGFARRLFLAVVVCCAALPAAAHAQAPGPLRFAAPADCLTNPGCGVALRQGYGIDATSVFTPLVSAGGGIAALDAGTAEVVVAFSSDPQLSRPDLVTLTDDKRAVSGSDNIVPVLSSAALRRAGDRFAPDIRRRLNAVSRELTTLELRSLGQQLDDGTRPLQIADRFVDRNGLVQGFSTKRRKAPRLVIGYQDFDANLVLARVYAEALGRAGYRVSVRSVRGFRREALAALASGSVAMTVEYAASLLTFLRPSASRTQGVRDGLPKALTNRRLVALDFAPAVDTNTITTTAATARGFGLARVSDLAKYWPKAG
jgi:glycine betaine/choline ABC-type transport system substrate-binding protein